MFVIVNARCSQNERAFTFTIAKFEKNQFFLIFPLDFFVI